METHAMIRYPSPVKVFNDRGEVAVVYSPGYGSGWSTMTGARGLALYLLFDRRFVEAKQQGLDAQWVEQSLCLYGEPACLLGWDKARVAWLPVGGLFRVLERDGYERLEMVYTDAYVA